MLLLVLLIPLVVIFCGPMSYGINDRLMRDYNMLRYQIFHMFVLVTAQFIFSHICVCNYQYFSGVVLPNFTLRLLI